jgi:hypothetical protein
LEDLAVDVVVTVAVFSACQEVDTVTGLLQSAATLLL